MDKNNPGFEEAHSRLNYFLRWLIYVALFLVVVVVGYIIISTMNHKDSVDIRVESEITGVIENTSSEEITVQVMQERQKLSSITGLSLDEIDRAVFSNDPRTLGVVVAATDGVFTFLISPLAPTHISLRDDLSKELDSDIMFLVEQYELELERNKQWLLDNRIIDDLITIEDVSDTLIREGIDQAELIKLMSSIGDELRILIREFAFYTEGQYFTLSHNAVRQFPNLFGTMSYRDGIRQRYFSSLIAEMYARALLASYMSDTITDETLTEIKARSIFFDTHVLGNDVSSTLQIFSLVDQYFDLMRYSTPSILQGVLPEAKREWEYQPSRTINYMSSNTSIPLSRK